MAIESITAALGAVYSATPPRTEKRSPSTARPRDHGRMMVAWPRRPTPANECGAS